MKSKPPKALTKGAPSVLIADDDKPLVATLGRLFRQAGFRVSSVGEIEDCIRTLMKKRFDVVILDMRLPRTSKSSIVADGGLTVLKSLPSEIRAMRRFGLAPLETAIIVFTAYPTVDDSFAVTEAGAYYLPKTLLGQNVSAGLVQQCKRLVEEKRRCQKAKRAWLDEHFNELVEKFGGKTVAVIDAEIAASIPLRGGTVIGDREVFTARTREELRGRIVRNPKLRRAAPVLLTIPKEKGGL
jgi:DNA-binding response OmpR family regulator